MEAVKKCKESNGSTILPDPNCDPNNPKRLQFKKIEDAAKKIKEQGLIVRTTSKEKSFLSKSLGMNLYFKPEYKQPTGSFKVRGAAYSLLNFSDNPTAKGVITTSAGNHAQAMAYQGLAMNIPVTVVMPETAPQTKIDGCKRLNATVRLKGMHFNEARKFAMELGQKEELLYINGYDHIDILAGQGTAGLEIFDDLPDVDCIVVPVGGGGLISGVAIAAKEKNSNIKIIGVESERCPSWTTARSNNGPKACEISQIGAKDTVADGLAVIEVGCNAFKTANHLIDEMLLVSEENIARAVVWLLENEKGVVEGAGAAGLAAILSGQLDHLKGKNVVCILCGGNIDIGVLNKTINRVLMMEGRICQFNCTIRDKSQACEELFALVSQVGAKVIDFFFDPFSLPDFIHKIGINCTVETKSIAHRNQLHAKLEKRYGDDLVWNLKKHNRS